MPNKLIFNGEKLRLVRLFQGLTLEELGHKVAVSRQYIQKLERGTENVPNKIMVEALAETLEVDPHFFYGTLGNDIVQSEECHFRKLQTTPQYVRDRALAYGTIFNAILDIIEQKVKLPKPNIPLMEVKDRIDIERAAEKLRVHWGLRLDAPIANMNRTLETNGCIITQFSGVSEKIDAFSYMRSRPIIVKNNLKGDTARARFDLAHECGHIVLHRNLTVGNHDLEDEANQFASAFLMPRNAFVGEFPKNQTRRLNWQALYLMSKRWGVSIHALIRRAYELTLIDAVQYRNAYVYINRSQNKVPANIAPAAEPIELIPASFSVLQDHYGITPMDVAKLLKVKCSVLSKYMIKCDTSKNATKNLQLIKT